MIMEEAVVDRVELAETHGLPWIVLLTLGALGMFLSEFCSFNVLPVVALLKKGVWQTVFHVVLLWFVYVLMLTWLFDFVWQRQCKGMLGLILAGSIYGLYNEVVVAGKLFGGPAFLLGINLPFIAFTALFWHALIDGAFALLIMRHLLSGTLNTQKKWLAIKDIFGLLLGCSWWYSMSITRWQQKMHPEGIPLAIQWILVTLAVVFLLILVPLLFRQKEKIQRANCVLTSRSRKWISGFLVILLVVRGLAGGVLSLLLIVLLFSLYFFLFFYQQKNLVESKNWCFPIKISVTGFSWVPLMQISIFVLVSFQFFLQINRLFNLTQLMKTISTIYVLFGLLFAAIIPFKVLYDGLFTRKKRKQV